MIKQSAVSDQQSVISSRRLAVVNYFPRFFTASPRLRVALLLLLTAHCLLLTASAQTEESPDDAIAPPPLKILSKTEKTQLQAATAIKERTKLALELMEARLLNAETLAAKQQYGEMFAELGNFHALVDNTLDFLRRNNNDSGKVLNNFKRIEISLRKYITRLELIRRELPIKYESYVRQLTKLIRDARTEAVEPLFGNSVVPGKQSE